MLAHDDENRPAHINALYGYAIVLVDEQTEAEDLVEETFLRSMESVENYNRGTNQKVKLFAVLRNIWLYKSRKQRYSKGFPSKDDRFKQPNASDLSAARDPRNIIDQGGRVREVIRQLPCGYREIILLREFERFSYQEIGLILGYAEETVILLLSQTRSMLRVLLEKETNVGPSNTSLQKDPARGGELGECATR